MSEKGKIVDGYYEEDGDAEMLEAHPVIYALFAGIVLGLITELSGSLSAAVIAHMLMNLRSFVYLTWLTEAEQVRLIPDLVLISVGFAAMLCLLVRRGLREARAGTGETEDGGENDDD